MKILITGNMGYVGPVVVKHLRLKYPKSELYGFDIGYFANCLTGTGRSPESWLDRQYFGDMRAFPENVLNGVDVVVHLAAISNDPIGNLYEQVTLDINHRASVELAKKAKLNGVKSFVFASSCSMYGAADERSRIETDPLNPLSAYAKSKVFTERDIKPLADENFTVTCLRFSTACGMSDRLRLDLVLNDFVAGAVAESRITILSDGTPWRPLIDVKDMARAFDWAVRRDTANGGEFVAVNVGTDEWNYQVKDLAEAVAKVIPGTKISISKDGQPDKRSYKVNFELFRKLAPKYQPQTDLSTSVRELKDGLESLSFNDANFRNTSYMRLKVLNDLREKALINEQLQWQHS